MGIKSGLTKYDLYQILSTKDDLACFLPPAEMVENPEDALKFILRHKRVMLKPVYGSAGGGACIVEGYEDSYRITDSRRKKHIDLKLNGVNELEVFLKSIAGDLENYMLQKLIKSVKIEQSVFDFRLVMKKSLKGSWKCYELEYTSGRNNFLAVSKYRDDCLSVLNETIQKNYPLKFNFMEAVNEAKKLCARMCINIENTLGCEEGVEFEVAIDENLKPWFVEIHLLEPVKKFEAVDYPTYLSSKNMPLLYSVSQYNLINM